MANFTVGDTRFDFGRVVGQTFGLIGRNLFAFAFLALLLVGVPRFAIMVAQALVVPDRPDLAGLVPIVGSVLALITTYILQGSLTRASVDDLSTKGANIGAALGDGLRYFFPLFIVALLVGLGIFIGLLFLIVPGLFLMVRWAVSAAAVVVERQGPTHSIGRSAELTEGHRWAVFGLLLLYGVLAYGSSIGLGMVLATTGAFGIDGVTGIMTRDMAGYIFAGVNAAVESLVSLVGTVGMASLYFELRRVKEGVGIDELAKVFE